MLYTSYAKLYRYTDEPTGLSLHIAVFAEGVEQCELEHYLSPLEPLDSVWTFSEDTPMSDVERLRIMDNRRDRGWTILGSNHVI
ncbi:hypothetical protein FHR66_001457 [Xanthomonas sp. F4]